jgi:superfamily II DNA or RNA helicase
LHAIQYEVMNGSIKATERATIIENMRNSGHDGTWVLVLSNIGMVGLNLPFANIMVMMVSLEVMILY